MLFLHILSNICGDGLYGKGPNLLQGPGGGKNAKKYPVFLPPWHSAEAAGKGVGLILHGGSKGIRLHTAQLFKERTEKL
jgi:hypothetical protein